MQDANYGNGQRNDVKTPEITAAIAIMNFPTSVPLAQSFTNQGHSAVAGVWPTVVEHKRDTCKS